MKICCSISPATMSEAMRKLATLKGSIDLVEVRIDGMENVNLEELLRRPRSKVIVTNRSADEGGSFRGSAQEHFAILSEAGRHGAEYLDVELRWGKPFIVRLKSCCPASKLIISYHNFEKTPTNLLSTYHRLLAAGADVVKIAVMANSIVDNQKIFSLYRQALQDKQPLIALCMGERGEISRILAKQCGAFLTFGSFHSNEATAPGQYTISDMHSIFRVSTIDKRTKLFGLIGNPVAHSRGIHFHNKIFAHRKLNAVYVNFLVDDVQPFLSTFSARLNGGSVTMPFKQEIILHVDGLEGEAKILKAVNTIVRRKKRLIGYNTDVHAITDLLTRRSTLRNKRVIILGTGGTARTMMHAACLHGARVTVVGRSLQKAGMLARDYSCNAAVYSDLSGMDCDILMNATSLGMATNRPYQQGTNVLPKQFLKKDMLVFDAVYVPEMTPLLTRARMAGCRIITGVEFFTRQAQDQSRLFIESIS